MTDLTKHNPIKVDTFLVTVIVTVIVLVIVRVRVTVRVTVIFMFEAVSF